MKPLDLHFDANIQQPRCTVATAVYLIAMLAAAVVLGNLKGHPWHMVVIMVALWLVRLTSRWEFM